MIRSFWAIVLLLLVLAGGCRKTPAVTNDRSTPQAAVISFMHAIDQRDSSAVAEAFVANTPGEKAYAGALADLLAASGDLRKEAIRRFGSEDAKQLLGDAGPGDDDFLRLEQAAVAIQEDHATLATGDGQVFRLIKQGDQWKIQPGSEKMAATLPAAQGQGMGDETDALQRATAMMRRLSDALRSATQGITSGALASAEAARQAIARGGLEQSSAGGDQSTSG